MTNLMKEQQQLLRQKHAEILDRYPELKKRKEFAWIIDVGLTEGFSLGIQHTLQGNIAALKKLKEYRRDDQAPSNTR